MLGLLIVIIAKVMVTNNWIAVWRVSLGCKGRLQELQLEQVTIENLRWIFQVSLAILQGLQLKQVTMESLWRIFQVSLAIVSITLKYLNHVVQVYLSKAWLRDEVDRAVYLLQPDGNFNLQEPRVPSYASLIVEGPSALQLPLTNLPLSRSSSTSMSLSSTPGPIMSA